MPRLRLRRPALTLGHHPRHHHVLYGSVILLTLLLVGGRTWWARQPTVWKIPGAISLALSPDGTLLAIGRRAADDGDPAMIEIRRVADGSLVHRYPAPAIYSLRFSPDGTLLAGTSRSAAQVWRAADGRVVQHWDGYYEPFRIVWSADGARLAFANSDWIEIRRLADRKLLRRIEPTEDRIHDIAFGPDGTTLVSAGSTGLSLWRVADGQQLPGFDTSQGVPSTLAQSANGRYLAVDTEQGQVDVWDMQQPAPRLERTFVPGYPMDVVSVAFSPDGKRITASRRPVSPPLSFAVPLTPQEIMEEIEVKSRRSKIEIWSIADGTRRQWLRLRPESGAIYDLQWTQAERRLISVDVWSDSVYLWPLR